MALVALCCVVVVHAGDMLVQRARAATVAEGVALAVVTAGVAPARQLAGEQGARVASITDDGSTVGVTVTVGDTTATAHARRAAAPASTTDPATP